MSTFVFAVLPAIGHVNPMISIAHELRKQGHEIIFICFAPDVIRDHVEANGFRMEGIPGISPSLFKLVEVLMMFPSGYLEFMNGIGAMFSRLTFVARNVMKELEKIKPDMVVVDFALPGASLAAEKLEMPFTVIYHAGLCFKGPGIPPFGSGLAIGKEWGWRGRLYARLSETLEGKIAFSMGLARKRLGLSPGTAEPYTPSPWLTLVLTTQAIEAPRHPPSDTVFFIGPCISGREALPGEDTFPFDALPQDKPKIYVSLGTFFNNRPRLFRKIFASFPDDEYQIIVKAGGAYDTLSSLQLPSHILLFRNVPQANLLPEVDAVVSHGGNNTVNETLSSGKPLLVIPIGGEQGDNAAKVEYLGVGLRADKNRTTSREIRNMMDRLMNDPIFRERARSAAAEIERTDGSKTASQFILHVLRTMEPLKRLDGYPLTVLKGTLPPWEFNEK